MGKLKRSYVLLAAGLVADAIALITLILVMKHA
jgi:hypothetical protein